MRLVLMIFLSSVFMPAVANDATEAISKQRATMPTSQQSDPLLTAITIIERAHAAAGGKTWTNPKRLRLVGYNVIRRDGKEIVWDKYAMWREFAPEKSDAHSANGKVRIEAWTGDKLAMLLAFDGEKTYDRTGVMEDQSANAMWSNNFGYGAIRNALDEGWQQSRMPDDLVDGAPSYMIELIDPSGGKTLFGIRQTDYAIVYVGFETPRGWHERRYSNFFSKPGVEWRQAGRVRLFYNGVKANEAVWTDFEIGGQFEPSLFVIRGTPFAPSF